MLCHLAQSFPHLVAKLLERDRGLKRNFREETVTDLLMASLVGLQSFGIRVDFPDEPTTGGDMDWIYAAPLEVHGGSYLRILLQAKRAQFSRLKRGGYWYYRHLDHGTPAGQQAQTLTAYASSSPDGMSTLPLYILYHPSSALTPATGGLPPIEGINIVFASCVAPIVLGGCTKSKKRVDYWRNRFMSLSDLLCWPTVGTPPRSTVSTEAGAFVVRPDDALFRVTGGFHPDLVATRLLNRRKRGTADHEQDLIRLPIEPTYGIPPDVRRAIHGQITTEDLKNLKRPRVILSTHLRRDDPEFALVKEVENRIDT